MAFLGPSLRRKRVTDRPAARLVTATVVSLALNGLFLLLVARLGAFEPMKLGRTEQVALESLTADQWNANRAIAGLPPAVSAQSSSAPAPTPPAPIQAQPPPPPPEVKERPKGQVVDVAPSPDSRAPDSSRFLSERNNRVEKETRSRWAGTEVFKNRAPAPVRGESRPPDEAGDGGNAKETREAKAGQGGTDGKAGKEGPARKPAPPASDERLAMLERPQKPGLLGQGPQQPLPGEKLPAPGEEGHGTPGAPGERQEGQKKLGDVRLLPSVQSMSRITAGPSADYIDRDVEVGEETALNTREFRFASFWNRFKQDVADRWFPAISYNYRARDPDGTMFGGRDRITELHIVLDASGAVKDIKMTESSGLEFLDRIAIKAVREASPFYNVPPALLNGSGEFAFDFGFLVEGSRGIPVRPRYQPGMQP